MHKSRIALLLLVPVALLLAVAVYWNRQESKKRFNWEDRWTEEAYSARSEQPYGTQVLHRLLENYCADCTLTDITTNVGKVLAADSTLNAGRSCNYVFAGEALYLDSLSTARLLAFVAQGNTAFIASKSVPFDLMFHIYYEECDGAEWDDYKLYYSDKALPVRLKEPNPDQGATLHYARQNEAHPYQWHYIGSAFFCPEYDQRPLGYIEDSLINFASFPHGKGQFLLYTTPLALTNYSLLRPDVRQYAANLLAHLPPGHIYWDAVSAIPEQVSRRRNHSNGGETLPEDHPLKYILQQPSLAWAWYLLLVLAILWIAFRGKRRQRVIPVLPVNENTSWQFINTIANLYFRGRNYRGMSREQMRLFMGWLREKYNLSVSLDHLGIPRTDASFFDNLSLVSEVPQEDIQSIFSLYTASVRYEPTEEMMINLHRAIEGFMKRAK
jgi:hypothetical protein